MRRPMLVELGDSERRVPPRLGMQKIVNEMEPERSLDH